MTSAWNSWPLSSLTKKLDALTSQLDRKTPAPEPLEASLTSNKLNSFLRRWRMQHNISDVHRILPFLPVGPALLIALLVLLVLGQMPSPSQHLTIWSSPKVRPCFISSAPLFTFHMKMHMRDKEKSLPDVRNWKLSNPWTDRGDTMWREHSGIIRKRKKVFF